MRFDLVPGNCDIPDATLDRADGDGTEYSSKYEAIKQQGNYGLTEEGDNNDVNLPWQNLIDGNALERESTETSRGFDTTEVFEPVLRKDKSKINRGRNLEGFAGDQVEILEPILKSTTQRTRDQAKLATQIQPQLQPEQTNRKSRDEQGFISVQLFPFRLGELLERAERYARQTLLPLISETAPRFFGFGTVVSDESNNPTERKGKEISITEDQIISESQPKNIYESLRETQNQSEVKTDKIVQSRSVKEIKFYSNENDLAIKTTEKLPQTERSGLEESFTSERRGHQISLDDIRIDLPTYRPPGKVFKDFPYEFMKPGGAEESNTDGSSTTINADETTTIALETSTTKPTTTTFNTPTREGKKIESSWLKFDIPVFRALSRSFQDWTASSSARTTTTTPIPNRRSESEAESSPLRKKTARRFIPLLFGGGVR